MKNMNIVHSYQSVVKEIQEEQLKAKYRVAIYVRLSDEDRDKENPGDDSVSITNQKSMLMKYAEEQGWKVVSIFCDDDFSGVDQSTVRPDFERMIKDCENGKIDIVLCKHQSRFSRDLEVIEKYLHNKFLEWGVRFVSILDNADTFNKSNKKSRQINGLINEWYVEDLSENIRATLKTKKRNGEFTGSFAPYGYLISKEDKHKLEIDETAAPTIRKIYELYLNGNGYLKIADYLTQQGIPTPSKHKELLGSKFVCGQIPKSSNYWNRDTIRNILLNQMYIGDLVQGKVENISYKNKKKKTVPKEQYIIVKNTHEPIIDEDTWKKAHNIMDEKGKRTSYKTGDIHMFSRKVYCKCCNSAFTKNNRPTKYHEYVYLRCKKVTSSSYACNNSKGLRYDELEKLVLSEINQLIIRYKNPEQLKKGLNEKLDDKNDVEKLLKEKEKEKALIKKELDKKNNMLISLYSDKEEGIISKEEFILLKNNCEVQNKTIMKRIDEIDLAIENLSNKNNENVNLDKILSKYEKIDKLDHTIICTFIKKIYVDEVENGKRNIEIEWNI